MTVPPRTSFTLTLLGRDAVQKMWAVLAVAALLWAGWGTLSSPALRFDTAAPVLLGGTLALLALALRFDRMGVLTAQRLGVAALATFWAGCLLTGGLGAAAGLGSPHNGLMAAALWLLPLTLLMFVCLPRAWAAAAALALAGLAASVAGWTALSAPPDGRTLALHLLAAQVALCGLLYGLAAQVQRLAQGGDAPTTGAEASAFGVSALPRASSPQSLADVHSVDQLVARRQSGLRRLQRQCEQAERTATQREAELRTMLDAFPGVVLRVESTGTISYCNPRAAALLGLSAPELDGRHARKLLGEEGYQKCCSRKLQMQAGGAPVSFEMTVKRADGGVHELLMTQFLVASAAPGGTAVYQMGVDIGERKRAEAALARAKSDAERANQAKSRVMSSISHELRTPLNAVLGLAQMLRAPGQHSDHQQQLHLQAIADAGKDLLALVDETLDLSRIDAGDMRVNCVPVNLAEMVRVVLSTVAALAAEQRVTLAPAPSLRHLWVQADPVRLRQVLLNLLSNAIKYNRPGGGVAVRVTRRGNDAHLVVQDTGVGLTAEQQRQLFQPFNRLGAEHSGVPGTGIGLSIAHGLVGLMGGRMDVRSQPGVGSEFIVWMPALEAQPPAQQQRPAPSLGVLEEDHSLLGRVLYVEDNEVNVLVFQACLARRPNVKLRVARNGAEALADVAREPVDLVVLDMNLPDQTGLDLARALRQHAHAASAPMVLLTADATSQTAHRAVAHGIQRIWHKPFDAARLLTDLDDILRVSETV